MPTYYFSRFSILMEPDYIKKMEYLYNILIVGKSMIYRKDSYKAINIEIRKVGNKSYITGRLIKYEPEHLEKKVNDKNEIEDIILENHLLANVRFIFDANESLLIYEQDRSHIPKDSFSDRFISILKNNTEIDLLPITITPVTESYNFMSRLKEIKEIKKIVINLHPSNPNNRERWKIIDEKLKNDKITDYKETQENKIPGGGIIVDEDTISKIMMGEDGYGTTVASGKDDKGEDIEISTVSTEVQAKAGVENKDNIEEEIKELQNKIGDIKNKPDAEPQ